MSISPKQTKSFTSKEVQIQINTFLKEINTALSSIDIFEDSEMISLRNNTDNDEKYHKINSHVYLVSSISKGNENETNDFESTIICFSNQNTKSKHFSIFQ
jgi:hypothetical protein